VEGGAAAVGVASLPPAYAVEPGFPQAGEPMLIEAFVAVAPVEARDHAVLDRLPRLDVRGDAVTSGPGVEGPGAELRPKVQRQPRWAPAAGDEQVQRCDERHAG
jgi:hypothetical protein